jgi:anti-sigma factor RsiW
MKSLINDRGKTMECIAKSKDGADVLVEYCSGAMNAARTAEVEKHTAECADCRRVVEAQTELWQTLDGWRPPEVSENFDARLYARIAREESAPSWKKWARRILQPAVPAGVWKPAVSLAAACAVLTVGLMVRTPNPSEQGTQLRPEKMSSEPVDIEQIANALDDLEMLTPGSAM